MDKKWHYESPIPPAVKKLELTQERIRQLTEPYQNSFAPLRQIVQKTAFEIAKSNITASSAALSALQPLMVNYIHNITESLFQLPPIPHIETPFLDFAKNVLAFDCFQPSAYLQSIIDSLRIDHSSYIERYHHHLYKARWFPLTGWQTDFGLVVDINEILSTTRDSKNRVKKLDRTIFAYYSKERIEVMKKEWREEGLPEYLMRILHQAVQAYHRKEYALTTIVLSTVWEGIIYNKVSDRRGKRGDRTKENFSWLIAGNQMDEVFKSFFEDFVMYNCYSPQEAIPEVPGRNSLAHSMYTSYPTRKAALNAILFTDLLLKIDPVNIEDCIKN